VQYSPAWWAGSVGESGLDRVKGDTLGEAATYELQNGKACWVESRRRIALGTRGGF